LAEANGRIDNLMNSTFPKFNTLEKFVYSKKEKRNKEKRENPFHRLTAVLLQGACMHAVET
jgi:hypothetical protein